MSDAARKRRVREAVKFLQVYIGTYDNQAFYESYSDNIIINDVLYGLGLALHGDIAKGPDGYSWFKREVLLPHLQQAPATSGDEQL